MQDFGWSLKSSQEINNTDSHLEDRGGTTYSVTTKENYVKLVFDRETKMDNYDRICSLEQMYTKIINSEPEKKHIGISWIIAIIGLLIYVVPGALYLGYKFWRRSQATDEYNAAYAAWKVEYDKAVGYRKEARSLIS